MSKTNKFCKTLNVSGKEYVYFDINQASQSLGANISKTPYSLKVLFENLLRHHGNGEVTEDDVLACANHEVGYEIAFNPTRVLMQDFTGVPAVVDLASMRDAIEKIGGDPKKINPLKPVDLVIDHSVQVDKYGGADSLSENVKKEMQRNFERYQFLRWGQDAFDNFKVVPPGTGICHQVNLEYLSQVVWSEKIDDVEYAYPDSLVGTDSHTTMVNGLSVLGWGVGGIEAEAVMLGKSMSMLIPEVIGFRMYGALREGVTATDLVLTVTQMLRKKNVVNKFVEFCGPGVKYLTLADRATIANMAPEYGATCGFFPIDDETINYLTLTARSPERIELVKAYAKKQGLWSDGSEELEFNDILELDLSIVEPSLAGPKRPQDRVALSKVSGSFEREMPNLSKGNESLNKFAEVFGHNYKMGNGDIVIAAITSCTNTSNPYVLMAAGLMARNAVAKGLSSKPWVKTSLAPGSQVVAEYLEKSGLQKDLDKLGFNIVGFGCTTCIGNSGPLKPEVEQVVTSNDLVVVSVLSGNRNFEGRVHPLVKANYLASPPLVVAYALAGSINVDITTESLGKDHEGKDVYLKDIWPSNKEVSDLVNQTIDAHMFATKYANLFAGSSEWQSINFEKSKRYMWNEDSTYIANPPYFDGLSKELSQIKDIKSAIAIAKFGDSITTDHISPAGNIASNSPAAEYLKKRGVAKEDFNSYGARRGHHEVMMRGTFANIRIKNQFLPGVEGGFAKYLPTDEVMSIYDVAMKYQAEGRDLVIVAGKEYGSGSSRDWAAKGTMLLGIKAVIAESFERIHRSNLVRMGVIPLTFAEGMSAEDLNLDGSENFDIIGLASVQPLSKIKCKISRKDGQTHVIQLLCRIDTENELEYVKYGGIMQYTLLKAL